MTLKQFLENNKKRHFYNDNVNITFYSKESTKPINFDYDITIKNALNCLCDFVLNQTILRVYPYYDNILKNDCIEISFKSVFYKESCNNIILTNL